MLVLAKAVLSIMLGFSVSVVFGYFAIKWLKKKHIRQQVSNTLGERHKKKKWNTYDRWNNLYYPYDFDNDSPGAYR